MKYARLFLIGILLLAGGLTTGCATDAKVIDNAAQMNAQLAPATMSDAQLAGYLQAVGDRIIATAKEMDAQGYDVGGHKSGDNAWMFSNKMQFHFVNSKTVNAFTTGGEHMYVYNALFQMCKSEEELAAVMAHEYGHVYARHVAKGMNRQYGVLAAMAAAGAAGYVAGGKDHGVEYAALGAGIGGAGASFLNMGFTRSDEAEADKAGFNFYTRAGWDPNHFADFFREMIKAGYDKTPAIQSDHPTLASRVEDSDRRVKELPPVAKEWRKPPVADASKFRELQARAQALSTKMPDDTTLKNSQQLLAALPRSCVVPYTTKDEIEARQSIATKAQAPAQTAQPAAQPDAAQKKKKKPAAS